MDRDEDMQDVDVRRGEDFDRERRDDRDTRSATRDVKDRGDDRRDDDRRREHHHRHRSRSRTRSPHRSSRHHRDDKYSARSRSRSRSRDRYRRRRGDSRDRSRSRDRDHRPRYRDRSPPPRSVGGPMNATTEEAEAHAKQSVKENRVYVGNLSYTTTYKDLEKFCKKVGDVAFSEIFVTPAGQSKGCGIVEFVDKEGAERAVKELTEQKLLGRPCFIREDREAEARFGAPPIPGRIGSAMGEGGAPFGGRGGFRGGAMGAPPRSQAPPDYRQLFIGNLPAQATWQDMKDLFREAGNVIRADVGMYPNGQPKGTGIVVYESHEDAENAVQMFNGYSWFETIIQVRPDRFAAPGGARGGRGGFVPRGGFIPRGGFVPRGGFNGGFNNGMGMMGGHMGGHMGGGMPGGGRGGRNFTNDLYADYNGPDGTVANVGMGGMDPAVAGGDVPAFAPPAEPSAQIHVRNLPWSTSNEDLVELFETTGSVVLAEILFEGQRSKGSGVVQFKEVGEAEEACLKFTGYVYGGRPLDVRFNDRWHEFSETAAAGGSVPSAA